MQRRMVNLRPAGRWYSISNAATDGPAVVSIYDEIGYWGVTAADFVKDLGGVKGDLELHINSPGGDVFDGITILNALRAHKGQVSVVVDGLAASSASFIAMAASPGRLEMAPNSTLMIHDAWGLSVGSAADMRKMADLLDQQSDNIASVYSARSGRPASEWRAAMAEESWYVGQQAVDAGLADRVRSADGGDGQGLSVAAQWDLSVFRNVPASLRNDTADGDGPGVDESAWDGPAAMSAAANSDDPAAALNAICAGKRAGDPKTEAAHALPHHKHPGAHPNRAGVTAALGRLGQTQGLTNKAEAEAHLKAHQSAISTDNDADDGGASNQAGHMPAWLTEALTAKEAASR